MPITFPRKFTHGQKVGSADVYGELFIWPEGYFHYMVHTRGHDSKASSSIHVALELMDGAGQPIGTYGMAPDQDWRVGPGSGGLSAQRFDELYGKIPEDKLARTDKVALVFRASGQEAIPGNLGDIASTGDELEFCPNPD